MVAVGGVDAQLVHDFITIFAPVLDVDEGVMKRCAVLTFKGIALPQPFRRSEDIGVDDAVF